MNAGLDLRLLRAAVFTAVCVTLSAAGHTLADGQRVPWWSLGVGCAVVFAVAVPLAGRERSLPGIAALLAAGQVALHTLFACGLRAASMQMPMRVPMRPQAGPAPHGAGSGGAPGGGGELRRLAAQLLCNGQSADSMSDSRARHIVSDAGLGAGHLHGPGGRSGTGHFAGHLTGQTSHAGYGAGHQVGHGAAGVAMSAAEAPLQCLRSAAHDALSLLDGPMILGHLLAALVLGWLLRRGEVALWRLVRLSARSARTAVSHVRALRTAIAYVRALCTGLLPDAPARVCAEGARDESAPRSVLLHHSVHRRGPPRQPQSVNPTEHLFALAA